MRNSVSKSAQKMAGLAVFFAFTFAAFLMPDMAVAKSSGSPQSDVWREVLCYILHLAGGSTGRLIGMAIVIAMSVNAPRGKKRWITMLFVVFSLALLAVFLAFAGAKGYCETGLPLSAGHLAK